MRVRCICFAILCILSEALWSGSRAQTAPQTSLQTRCSLGRAIAQVVRVPEFCPMLVLTDFAKQAINTFRGDQEFQRCLKIEAEKMAGAHYTVTNGTPQQRQSFCQISGEVHVTGTKDALLQRR